MIMIMLLLFISISFVLYYFKAYNKYKEWIEGIETEANKYRWIGYHKIALMNLNDVIKIYYVNPKRFQYVKGHIEYNGNQEPQIESKWIQSFNEIFQMPTLQRIEVETGLAEEKWEPETTVAIKLSFKDYYRFLRLKKKYYKRKQKIDKEEAIMKKANQELQDTRYILESVQKDINRLKEESEKQISEAVNKMKEVVENG